MPQWSAPPAISPDDLALTLGLLREVLPSERWDDDRYLDYWYNRHPNGPVIQENLDDEGERLIHVAAVPIRFANAEREVIVGQIVNASASKKVQRMGKYVKRLMRVREVAGERGGLGVFGVSNVEGTPAAMQASDSYFVKALPVLARASAPFGKRRRSQVVDESWLAGQGPDEFIDAIDQEPRDSAWRQVWTPELLRWRLEMPGGTYVVHEADEVYGISCRVKVKGLPVAFVMGLFKRAGQTDAVVSGAPIAAQACRFHRVPVAVYAGTNDRVSLRGVPLPRERLPSPLNVIFGSAEPQEYPSESFRVAALEFCDFDNY